MVRFKHALVSALPDLPEQELVWRMHFMFGAMSYAMAGNDALQLIATCDVEGADDAEAIIRRLVPFLTAGLQAGVTPSPPSGPGALTSPAWSGGVVTRSAA